MPATIDVRDRMGAILLGCFIAVALSGIVAFQACIYFRLYPSDKPINKVMVAVVWTLDVVHTCLICTSAWTLLIANFGNAPPYRLAEAAISIGVAALIIVITHLFYLQRLLHLSKRNWFIVVPTFVLVLGRLVCGLVLGITSAWMHSFDLPVTETAFALEVILSTAADVVITSGMCFYLQGSRGGFGTMNDVVDSVIIYIINNGTLTCVLTIALLISWAAMRNLIFLALHFVIAKVYANSLFAMLNMRKNFRGQVVSPNVVVNQMPVLSPQPFNRNNHGERIRGGSLDFIQADTIEIKAPQITIETIVQHDDDRVSAPRPQTLPAAFELKSIDGAGTVV